MRDLPQGTTLEKHGLGMPSGAPVADAFHHRAVLLRQRLVADFAVHESSAFHCPVSLVQGVYYDFFCCGQFFP